MDKATFTGLLVAIGGIVLGLWLEGGNIGQVLQPTAAMIVFGGTFGAVLIQFPLPVVLGAVRRLADIFFVRSADPGQWIRQLVGYANKARRERVCLQLGGEIRLPPVSRDLHVIDTKVMQRATKKATVVFTLAQEQLGSLDGLSHLPNFEVEVDCSFE